MFSLVFGMAPDGTFFRNGDICLAFPIWARFRFHRCRATTIGRAGQGTTIQSAGIQGTGKIVGQLAPLPTASATSDRCDREQKQEGGCRLILASGTHLKPNAKQDMAKFFWSIHRAPLPQRFLVSNDVLHQRSHRGKSYSTSDIDLRQRVTSV
jgi:hypothetical protein